MSEINHTTADLHWPLPSFHAVDWAHAFIETFGNRRAEIDEAVMTGWFANALMRGFDEHTSRHRKELEQLQHDLSAMREELRETRLRLWKMTCADDGD